MASGMMEAGKNAVHRTTAEVLKAASEATDALGEAAAHGVTEVKLQHSRIQHGGMANAWARMSSLAPLQGERSLAGRRAAAEHASCLLSQISAKVEPPSKLNPRTRNTGNGTQQSDKLRHISKSHCDLYQQGILRPQHRRAIYPCVLAPALALATPVLTSPQRPRALVLAPVSPTSNLCDQTSKRT